MAKILIIDDSRTSRKMLRNFLKENGYEDVVEAENGVVGVEKYEECQPDLVTMDITMPIMDGLEALEAIMKLDQNAKVIMVTAAGQESKVTTAIKQGASEFVTKPFDKTALLDAVNKVLKG